jgi:hypothetical protein
MNRIQKKKEEKWEQEKRERLDQLRHAANLLTDWIVDLNSEADAEVADAVANVCQWCMCLPALLRKLADVRLAVGLEDAMNDVPELSERLARAESRILTDAAEQIEAAEKEFRKDEDAALKGRETRMERGEYPAWLKEHGVPLKAEMNSRASRDA